MQMVQPNLSPTSDSDLNGVLHEFVTQLKGILKDELLAVYLQGSFALGDWDSYSDVDFMVVIENELSKPHLALLQAMHARIYQLDSEWAKHLEGSYFPRHIVRRVEAQKTPLWYLDNGATELVPSLHDNDHVVRWVVREYGIPLYGADAKIYIDPVPVDAMRQEITATMHDWAQGIFTGKYNLNNRWAQPFAVLSYCRMLHSLETGRIHSKPKSAAWAQVNLEPRWKNLIQRAWDERPNPSEKVWQSADPDDLEQSYEFIRYALAESEKYK